LSTEDGIVLVGLKNDLHERALLRQVSAFEGAFAGCKVDVILFDFPELYDRLVLKREILSDRYDVAVTLTEWLPHLLREKALTPLNPYIAQEPPEDWPHGWNKSLLTLQRDAAENFYGLPFDDGPILLFYRKDLLHDKRERELFRSKRGRPLRVPDTWNEFLQVAQHFTRPDEHLFGTCLAARPDGHDNVHGFLVQLFSRGGRLLNSDMQPVFDSREGVEGLQFYSDLISRFKVSHPDSLNVDSTGAGEAYSRGEVFMAVDWTNVGSLAEEPGVSRVCGKTGSWVVPKGDGQDGRHTSLGIYWIMGIPAQSKRKNSAYKFARFMASREMDKITSLEGANGSRISTWNDKEIVGRWPFYATFEKAHEDVQYVPQIPEYTRICESINDAMDSVLRGRSTAKRALSQAAEETRLILRS
jgi:multiple sugar transport system substrate-binding protein